MNDKLKYNLILPQTFKSYWNKITFRTTTKKDLKALKQSLKSSRVRTLYLDIDNCIAGHRCLHR